MGNVGSTTTQSQNTQTAKPTLEKGQATQQAPIAQAPAKAPVVVPVSTTQDKFQTAPAKQAEVKTPCAPVAQQAPVAQAPAKGQTQSQTAQQAPAAKAK